MMSLATLFAAISASLALPPGLLASVCYVESNYDVRAIHVDDGGADSIGVCQIRLETAQRMGFKGTADQLRNPYSNVLFSGLFLRHQLTRYHNDVHSAVAAYNSGSVRLNSRGKFRNQRYVTHVMRYWKDHYAQSNVSVQRLSYL